MLDLAPEIEDSVREAASQRGLTVNELLERTYSSAHQDSADEKPAKRQIKLGIGPNPVPADDPVLLFLQAQLAEAENATPEEIAAADAEYKLWQQNMDAPRRANGERLLFPDVEPL